MACRAGIVLLLIASFLVGARSVDAAPGGIEYRRGNLKALRPGTIVSQKVTCPSGSKVIGGGWFVDVEGLHAAVVSSAPFDDGDRGRKPDDGWRSTLKNVSATEMLRMRTWATCASRGSYVYVRDTFNVGGGRSQRGVLCPATSGPDEHLPVVGGGATFGTPLSTLDLGSTGPADDADVDVDRDDGWVVHANNDSGVTQELVVHAICATTGNYVYETPSPPYSVDAGSATGTGVECDNPDTIVTSGGSILGGSSTSVEMVTSYPLDSVSDANTRPDNVWVTNVFNGSSGGVTYIPVAICMVLA